MSKKQTAVEWLTEQIAYKNQYGQWKMWHKYGDLDQIINEAKAMEREQVENDFRAGKFDWYSHLENCTKPKQADQYYNETYGGEEAKERAANYMMLKGALDDDSKGGEE